MCSSAGGVNRQSYSGQWLLAQHHPPPSFRSKRERHAERPCVQRCSTRGSSMSEPEETYDDKRARELERLLRELAARISELDSRGELLRYAGELTKRIGDI